MGALAKKAHFRARPRRHVWRITGRPYGATYIRIDESKILKLRFPLDDGFRKVDSKVQEKLELPDLPPLPLIDGQLPPIEGLPPLDLADLPPIEGLPPLPPLK